MKTFENAYEFVDFCRGRLNNPFFIDLQEGVDKLRSGNQCCQTRGFSLAVGAKYADSKNWLTQEDKDIISYAVSLDWVRIKHMNRIVLEF